MAFIAQGCLTNSKHPRTHVGCFPSKVSRGNYAHLHDAAGNKYLDYICGLGTNLLGYSNPFLTDAIGRVLQGGFTHSLATPLEEELGEKLVEVFKQEKWKILCTGSEACSAAIRIARAATGRNLVISNGYHGWSDAFTSLTPPAHGVPPHQSMMAYDKDCLPEAAAIIIEPDAFTIGGLQSIRNHCDETDTLLIYDEVITGLRYQEHSVANATRIRPDLTVIGKALGGGMPIAAVGGRGELMDGNYFVSSTNAGNVLGLAAAMATLTAITSQNRYNNNVLWKGGGKFKTQFNKLSDLVAISGYNTRGRFEGTPSNKALFFQECCKVGIMFGPSWFINYPLLEYTDQTISICKTILGRMGRGEIKLAGRMPSSPFAARVRASACN